MGQTVSGTRDFKCGPWVLGTSDEELLTSAEKRKHIPYIPKDWARLETVSSIEVKRKKQ